MSEEKPPYDVQQAHLALEQDRQGRIAEGRAIIEAALARLRLELAAIPQLTGDGRVIAVVQLVAR